MPSARIVQIRSTLCHGPSWQYMICCGSVGENWMWLSQSVEAVTTFRAPVFTSIVKISIGIFASSRSLSRTSLASA